tara:strand:- start:448 stop:630 length:183 start_codon:yes stop_codon:yes gene_type:complete
MLAQKIIIEQIIKALGKKSKKKAADIEEKIERLFKIQQNHDDRIKQLEETAIKSAPWKNQ